MQAKAFPFIDLPTSAERLGITRHRLLEMVDEGLIKPFSGKGQQSVFRARDVDNLATQLGIEAAAEQEAEADAVPAAGAEVKRTRRRDAIKLIGTRISMDSRWAEISDKDLEIWLDALEHVQYDRVRRVANIAIERLQKVLSMLDSAEAGNSRANPDRPQLEP